MSRTKPKVLMEIVDKTTYKCDQIVEAFGIWDVFYDNQPINFKSQHYLDNEAIQEQLIQFKVGDQAHVVFYLPQIHCVSCVWLLENLHKINPGIIQSQTHFEKREIKVVYQPSLISLKQLVQLDLQ